VIDGARTLHYIVEDGARLGQLAVTEMLECQQAHCVQTQRFAPGALSRRERFIGPHLHLLNPVRVEQSHRQSVKSSSLLFR
jgi:hypothetical protein